MGVMWVLGGLELVRTQKRSWEEVGPEVCTKNQGRWISELSRGSVGAEKEDFRADRRT